jgi:hypothetical protein
MRAGRQKRKRAAKRLSNPVGSVLDPIAGSPRV